MRAGALRMAHSLLTNTTRPVSLIEQRLVSWSFLLCLVEHIKAGLWVLIGMWSADLFVLHLLFHCQLRSSPGFYPLDLPQDYLFCYFQLWTNNILWVLRYWWPILAHGRHVRDRKVVYLGETHGEPAVVGLHTAVLNTLVSQVNHSNKSWLVNFEFHNAGRRERFKCKSFSLYGAFQSWASGMITGCLWTISKSQQTSGPLGQIPGWRGEGGRASGAIWQVVFNTKEGVYSTNVGFRVGDEGFLLAPYSPLLRLAKKHSKTVKLKGGFVPKR